MSKLDVVNDPIEDMVFAVEAENSVQPVTEKTFFVFSLTPEGGKTQKTYVGLREAAISEIPGANKKVPTGQTLHVFVFPDVEKPKLRAVQAQVRKLEAEKTHGSLSISVEPQFCRTMAQIPPNAKYSVFVARSQTETLMPLLADMKVKDLQARGGAKFLQPCS